MNLSDLSAPPLAALGDERARQRMARLQQVRLLIVGVALLAVAGGSVGAGLFVAPRAIFWLVLGAMANYLFGQLLFARAGGREVAWRLPALVESMMLVGAISLLGGSRSPLLPLVLVQILATSLLANGRLGVHIAMVDVALVGALALGETLGWWPIWPVVPPDQPGLDEAANVLGVLVWGAALLLTAYVGGYVAALLRDDERASLTRENRELIALRRISRAVAAEQPLAEVIVTILAGVKQVLDLSAAYLAAPEMLGGALRLFLAQGSEREALARLLAPAEAPVALPTLGEARQRIAEVVGDEPLVIVNEVGEIAALLGLRLDGETIAASQRRSETRRYVIAPLRAEREVVGILIVALPRALLQREEVRSLLTLATEAGRALHLAHLREARASLATALQRRNSQLARIIELSNDLRLEMSESELLQCVVEGVRATLGMEMVVLSVVEGGQLQTAAWSGRAEELPPPMLTKFDRDLLRAEAQVGRSFLLRGRSGPPLRPGEPWQEGDRLIVPMEVRGRILGYLSFGGQQGSRTPNQSMIETLEVMASQAGLALQNARLFQEVADERRRLNAILSASAEPIVALNSAGEIMLINEAAVAALGLEAARAVGRRLAELPIPAPLSTLIPPPIPNEGADGNEPLAAGRAVAAGPRTAQVTLEDGRTYAVALAPLTSQRRTPLGWVLTMHDVTHFKQLDQLKNDFVNTVSHDLRAPLTAISGYAYLLHQEPLGPTGVEALAQIDAAVERMIRLIRDLLDLGRIESGLGFNKRPLDVEVVLKAVAAEMQPIATSKGLTLRLYALNEQVPLVSGDPDRLHQALVNLVQNAIKFTPPGGEVALSAERLTGYLAISVSDNGPGIPPADQPYIFDKFYRVGQRARETRQAEGSGLGLAIVKRIVEQHGGRIELISALNRGTTVRISLPTLSTTKVA